VPGFIRTIVRDGRFKGATECYPNHGLTALGQTRISPRMIDRIKKQY
jgi:hypothetical protein